MSIFNYLKSVLAFWKRRPLSEVSNSLLSRLKSAQPQEKKAAHKAITFGKKYSVSPKDLKELYEAELEYEHKKYKARHDYPYQTEIRKADIEVAKKEKYMRIKESISEDTYRKYLAYRDRLRKKYPQKAQQKRAE
jgi:hypothetical protein